MMTAALLAIGACGVDPGGLAREGGADSPRLVDVTRAGPDASSTEALDAGSPRDAARAEDARRDDDPRLDAAPRDGTLADATPPLPPPPPDATPTPPRDPLRRGLLGHWTFDEGSSSEASDASGHGHHAALFGCPPAGPRPPGLVGGALRGPGCWGEIAATPAIDGVTTELTIAAWVFLDAKPTDKDGILSRQVSGSAAEHYYLFLDDGRPRFYLRTDGDGIGLSHEQQLPRERWVHVAATYDGEAARIFVGGREVARVRKPIKWMATRSPVVLGGNANGAAASIDERLDGRLDEVRLYGRALSADELAELAVAP
jgi:hypothetical protein